ncbi:MAG TPA: class I adenylate-forming enzyme family protein [Mycobacteriales bacterium]|nr:class I adenylate-forming enzyme family protein [Mycobacteriales bacterium]
MPTVADAFDDAVRRDGEREAYVEGDRRITFAQWGVLADALAAELVDRGVRPGQVVAIMLPPSIDFAICYAAIIRCGAVATALNLRLGPLETAAIIAACEPAIVIHDKIEAAVPPTDAALIERTELDAICSREGLGPRRPHVEASDPAVIIWTSGTTGIPKGAWFDHDNLAAAVASAGVMAARHDRRLVATPFAHAGYMAKLWEQLETAATIVISPTPWRAEDTARLVIEERISMLGAAPTQWAKLTELPQLRRESIPALRIGICATAPAPPELIERVREQIGCPLIVRYAMTEAPSITGTDPDDAPEVQFRTVGRVQAGVEIRIVDERVEVRGSTVMRGYWRAPEATAEVLDAEGWLRTGDLGRITPDGNLVLIGRASDMYIRGGYNVHPLEVENILATHPAIDRAAVVGVPANVIGEIGVAYVVPTDPAQPPTLGEVREFVASQLADYKRPDQLEIIDALPLTAMLKVDKPALREHATNLRGRATKET